MPGKGGGGGGGGGVLHDNDNDDTYMTPLGRLDLVALGLKTCTNRQKTVAQVIRLKERRQWGTGTDAMGGKYMCMRDQE